MGKEYYIVVDDRRVGPLTFDQLRERTLEPSTLVWTAGMADWARADSLPELEPAIGVTVISEESAFGAYAQPEVPPHRPEQPYERPGSKYERQYGNVNADGQVNVRTNWKVLAIVATVAGFIFSCIGGIVGIFAILEANKADSARFAGDDVRARNFMSNCKTLTIVAFVLVGLGLLANIAYISKFVAFGHMF